MIGASTRWVVIGALSALGCSAPVSQRQRLLDSVQDANTAARFGRMDLATEHITTSLRDTFLRRRALWGNEIRVVDVNVSTVESSNSEAQVTLQVLWTRMNEGLLRTTALLQEWSTEDRGSWHLTNERRVGGDTGLFGEQVLVRDLAPRKDAHFPSRSLGSTTD